MQICATGDSNLLPSLSDKAGTHRLTIFHKIYWNAHKKHILWNRHPTQVAHTLKLFKNQRIRTLSNEALILQPNLVALIQAEAWGNTRTCLPCSDKDKTQTRKCRLRKRKSSTSDNSQGLAIFCSSKDPSGHLDWQWPIGRLPNAKLVPE